jgi:hypothetical protein
MTGDQFPHDTEPDGDLADGILNGSTAGDDMMNRDSVITESETRTMTDGEQEWSERTGKNVPAVDAYYKEEVWEPIESSRETGECPMGFGSSHSED